MENLYGKHLMTTKTNVGIRYVLKSVLREFSIWPNSLKETPNGGNHGSNHFAAWSKLSWVSEHI